MKPLGFDRFCSIAVRARLSPESSTMTQMAGVMFHHQECGIWRSAYCQDPASSTITRHGSDSKPRPSLRLSRPTRYPWIPVTLLSSRTCHLKTNRYARLGLNLGIPPAARTDQVFGNVWKDCSVTVTEMSRLMEYYIRLVPPCLYSLVLLSPDLSL